MNLPRLMGVIQLPPLTGSPRAHEEHPADSLQAAGLFAVREAQIFAQAGFDGILLENAGDMPYYPNQVPPETLASMAIIAAAVRETVRIQVGIHILRNDARAALAIAAVTGCDFIRIHLAGGHSLQDHAVLMRERLRLNASVALLADIDPTDQDTHLWSQSWVDGVIVAGHSSAHHRIEVATLQLASRAAKEQKISLYLDSSAGHDRLLELKPYVDGMILGSELRKGGLAGAALEVKKVREFSQQFAKASRRKAGPIKLSRTGKGRAKGGART